jgi:phospholipase C
VEISNRASKIARVSVFNRYTSRSKEFVLRPGDSDSKSWSLTRTSGWYDLAITVEGDSEFAYHLAGHLENGEDSISDPIMGGLV